MKVKRRAVREEEGVEGRGEVTREGSKEEQNIISFLSYAESRFNCLHIYKYGYTTWKQNGDCL